MRVAGFAWLTLVVLVAVYEAYAALGGNPHVLTLSEWVWAVDKTHAWFRYVFVALALVLVWHLFGR